jgi:hypothetical protein
MNSFLDKKAGWRHYLIVALVLMGVLYVFSVVTGHSQETPLTSTSVDITSMVVFGGLFQVETCR